MIPKINYFYLFLVLLALVFFYFGITMPMLNLEMDAIIEASIISKNISLLKQEHSIIGTMSELWSMNARFAAGLIFLFSLITPTLKLGLFSFCLLQKNKVVNDQLLKLVGFISKWSFADVLVVATMIAYLSAARNPETINEIVQVMGFKFPIQIQTPLTASFGLGFYMFVAFCFTSHLCTTFYIWNYKSETENLNIK